MNRLINKPDDVSINNDHKCICPQTFPTWPEFDHEEIEAVTKVLLSGRVNYWTGNEGRIFEKEFASFIGVEHAVATMNGTVALEAALFALGIGQGDEVIVTSRTFIASASCVVMRGAKPVFADVEPTSQNITAETIKRVITSRTKAIITVHLAGWPCEMDSIMTLARDRGLFVIEDCAQAHGASYKGRLVGSIGDIAAFSFCQDKIITTGGEGGMVTTNDHSLWSKVWSYKDHGKSYDAVNNAIHEPGFKWLHESFGTNLRMTEIQAAIGRIQLSKLPRWLAARKRNADILTSKINKIESLRIPILPENIQHAYYKYYCFLVPSMIAQAWDRDRIVSAINSHGVPCYSGSCSEIYLEKAFQTIGLVVDNRLPVAKELGETSIMFHVHPTLSEQNMMEFGDTINKVLSSASI
jgi:dTDP-4-amino-4,6-dideoxygalactose transaminase